MAWPSKEKREARRLERANRRREEVERREHEAERLRWEATDHGRAQLAFDAGESFFQVQRVISETKGNVLAMIGAQAFSSEVDQSAGSLAGLMNWSSRTHNLPITQTLAAIERIGWALAHVGYTYRETYSESRDKFLASGQQIATSGEIVAIYLFRRPTHRGQESSRIAKRLG